MTYTNRTKGLAILLAVCMLAVLLPAFLSFAASDLPGPYNEAYLTDPDTSYNEKLSSDANLAKGATVSSQYGAHGDGNWGWNIASVTDGKTNYLYKQDGSRWQVGNGGYHTLPGGSIGGRDAATTRKRTEWVKIDMGVKKTFNTVEIYPCRDGDNTCRAFPSTFDVDVSVDGETWMNVAHVGDLVYATDEYAPVTVQFDEVTAQYVRVNALTLNKDINGCYYMKLSEIAVFNREREAYCPNYALDASVSSSPCHNDGATWSLAGIHDGNRYNINLMDGEFGQYVGWHTGLNASGAAWIAFDLKAVKTVDKVVVVPATERYKEQNGGTYEDRLSLPQSIVIETSENGNDWSELTRLETMPTAYAPIEFTFTPTDTQYIRVYMPRNGHVKLSEIEIYDSTKSATGSVEEIVAVKDQNLALGATPVYSGVVNAEGWDPSKLNNGTVDPSGGFTSEMNPARAYAGYKFSSKTTVNKLVLYSAQLGDADIGLWSGLPKSYTVMYTNDGGLSWNVAASGTNATVPNGQEPMTITFDTIVATEIRVYADELYAKVSDFNHKYLQLAEMEVWYTDQSTELKAGDPISAYLQTRPATDKDGALVEGFEDFRIVLVGDMEKLAAVKSATVTVTFTLGGETVKTLTRVLGGANSQYSLYKSITAAGETYTAAEGSAIFGNVITDIPNGAYDALSIEIVDNADPSNIIYQGYTG